MGLFVHPQAEDPFAGAYDLEADEGIVRIFPPEVATGLKAFSFGYGPQSPSSTEWTDDGSTYVEIHGGLAATFGDQASLPPKGEVVWEEVWYPVAGLGGLTHGTEQAAIHLNPTDEGWWLTIQTVKELEGTLVVSRPKGQILLRESVSTAPESPFRALLPRDRVAPGERVMVHLSDGAGRTLCAHELALVPER